MTEYIFKNLLALYIGGSLRFVYLRYIRRNKMVTYSKVLHGIPNAKTKKDDTYNIKNEMKNRLTTLLFLVVLILLGLLFGVI